MKGEEATREMRDLLRNRWSTAVVFCLPILALIAAGLPALGQGWRTAIWVIALSTMGVGCIVNALRCRRVHCYVTGPFLIVMALIVLLYGIGVLRLGGAGWNLLTLAVLVGALALYYIPELLFGRYRRSAD
jgi:hypothetical protein